MHTPVSYARRCLPTAGSWAARDFLVASYSHCLQYTAQARASSRATAPTPGRLMADVHCRRRSGMWNAFGAPGGKIARSCCPAGRPCYKFVGRRVGSHIRAGSTWPLRLVSPLFSSPFRASGRRSFPFQERTPTSRPARASEPIEPMNYLRGDSGAVGQDTR